MSDRIRVWLEGLRARRPNAIISEIRDAETNTVYSIIGTDKGYLNQFDNLVDPPNQARRFSNVNLAALHARVCRYRVARIVRLKKS